MLCKYTLLIIILLANSTHSFITNNFANFPHTTYNTLKKCSNAYMNFDDETKDDIITYLEKIQQDKLKNKVDQFDAKVHKLKSVQNNINKYIEEKNRKPEKGHTTRYNNPIKKISFDKMFLNVQNIIIIYIPYDYDRAIVEFHNNQRFVYYIHNKNEQILMDKIINIASLSGNPFKVKIICDKIVMTDPFGYLYCQEE